MPRSGQITPQPSQIDGVTICGNLHTSTAKRRTYYCDLAARHVDNHEAHARDQTRVLCVWSQDGVEQSVMDG
jgi:hypothetical protein